MSEQKMRRYRSQADVHRLARTAAARRSDPGETQRNWLVLLGLSRVGDVLAARETYPPQPAI